MNRTGDVFPQKIAVPLSDVYKRQVLTGMLTKLPQAQSVFKRLSQLYAVDFRIPQYAPYAAALGAVLAGEGLDRKD